MYDEDRERLKSEKDCMQKVNDYIKNERSDKTRFNGIRMEKHIIKNHNLKPSTESDNICKDIDAWNKEKAISIKTQHTALKTGNIAFEYILFNSESYEKMDSWLITGHAEEYWIVVGEYILIMSTQKAKSFIIGNKNKWRKTKLTNPKLIEENITQGRKFNQSMCYLVPISEMKGIIERIILVEEK